MKKIVFCVAALVAVWGDPSWGVENGGGQPGSGTTTTAVAGRPQGGEAPAGVEAAVQEAVKLPPGSGQLLKAFEAALVDWVKKSPVEAFEWADKQEAVDRRRHYLPLVAMGLWVHNNLQEALAYAEKNPGKSRLGLVAGSWVGLDPVAASAWAAKQPKERWPEVISAVSEPWARREPKATAEWVLSLPPEQGCYGYFFTAAGWTWADPAAAAAWVAKLPEGKARDDAAGAVANVWGRKKPGDAEKIKEWVKGLTMAQAKKDQILKGLEKTAAQH